MEIEIRGWHVSRKKMFYSDEMVKDQMALLTNGMFINVSSDHTSMSVIYHKEKEFIPMLCTFAKDINGKEIYEGDILWCEHASHKGDVWFQDCEFVTDCFGEVRGLRDGDPVEVIGNVYENPEMVEGLIRI